MSNSTSEAIPLRNGTEFNIDRAKAQTSSHDETLLLSPAAAQKRVESQERTPKGQKIAKQLLSNGKKGLKNVKKQTHGGQIETDENSNSVLRSPTRYLMKQLVTTLSPKWTEIKIDEDRRVSRYGRHQKQKENIDYVPVELMRYVGNSPQKAKSKIEQIDRGSNNLTSPIQQETSELNECLGMMLPAVEKRDEQLLSMEEIQIIHMDESFEVGKVEENGFLDLDANANDSKNHSMLECVDADNASMDLNCRYNEGDICWGSLSKKKLHWPCIVRTRPKNKNSMGNSVKKQMEIEVNFFSDKGSALIASIKENCMLPFEGTDKYCDSIKNLEFGKDMRKAIRSKMSKIWYRACAIAEEFTVIPIAERLNKFDTKVSLDKARLNISKNRSRLENGRKIHDSTQSATQLGFAIKRERSDSPESPAYDALPIISTIHDQNEAKKMKISTSAKQNNLDENVDHDNETSVHQDAHAIKSTSFNQIEYNDVLMFCRIYLFDGHTSRDVEEKLQQYVQMICCLKQDPRRGTQRTVSRQRMQVLRKSYEKLGLQELTLNNGNNASSKLSTPPVRIKKEEQSLEEKFIYQLDRKYLFKGVQKGFVCFICNRPKNVTKCTKCRRHVHLVCLTNDPMRHITMQQLIADKRFLCDECSTPNDKSVLSWQKCFVCNDENDEIKAETKYKCIDIACTHQYHISCLQLYPQYRTVKEKVIVCPCHVCHTCVSNNARGTAEVTKAPLIRCIKCPATYHPDEACVPAGSELLTTSQLICPKHSLEQIPLNVNWCFLCCNGGDLICCETCPISFHRQCLPVSLPDGKYSCEECESGRMPLYNEIVVAKYGQFRWWPAITVPPPKIPEKMLLLQHNPSSICVKFFDSHDMAWMNRRRMYLYKKEDSENLGREKTGNIEKKYRRAMIEAMQIYKILETMKKSPQLNRKHNQKNPTKYAKIMVNRYIPPLKPPLASRQHDTSEDYVCHCKPTDDDPCGPTSSCINRAIMMECSSNTCPAKDRCSNQRFAKRIYPALEVRYFVDKGFGLVALDDLQSGQFIIEYIGEVINSQEFDRRIKAMQSSKEENFYFFTVEPDMTIDAGPKGNVARFINHSCEPNCETQKWTIGELRVIGLFAIKDIKAGEELTFNYNLESLGNSKRICLCGSVKCSGYIGEKYRPPKEAVLTTVNKRRPSNINKKTGKNQKSKKAGLTKKRITPRLVKAKKNIQTVNDDLDIISDPGPEQVDLLNSSDRMLLPIGSIKAEVEDDDG
ncbi:nuclear receptor binding SET domain protein [Anopheles nili]|uniref:nuclear receptor binding SET domain protein n=1 Tax=Anopheles nili TaxID=185578 RepID=UPI00237BE2E5|nr:nuclear receptor binding SET domain protein [Anopheles nili]